MAKRTDFQKAVRAAYSVDGTDNGPIFAEKVVCRADGSVELRHGYFYTFGNTADKWGRTVVKDLASVGIAAKVQSVADCWHAWPVTSYFAAFVVPA